MSVGGSVQLRTYRQMRRAMTRADAARAAGIDLGEAALIDADDERWPPPPQAFEPIPAPAGSAGTTTEEPAMAKRAKPGDDASNGVTNLTSTKKVLKEVANGFRDIAKQRSDLNEYAGELRERCRNHGIDPKWLLTALKVADMEPEDRERADESYAIARDAIGLSFRESLFDNLDEREESEENAARVKERQQKPPAPNGPAGDHDLAGNDPTDLPAAA